MIKHQNLWVWLRDLAMGCAIGKVTASLSVDWAQICAWLLCGWVQSCLSSADPLVWDVQSNCFLLLLELDGMFSRWNWPWFVIEILGSCCVAMDVLKIRQPIWIAGGKRHWRYPLSLWWLILLVYFPGFIPYLRFPLLGSCCREVLLFNCLMNLKLWCHVPVVLELHIWHHRLEFSFVHVVRPRLDRATYFRSHFKRIKHREKKEGMDRGGGGKNMNCFKETTIEHL